jgi:hypothetical protein
MFSIISGILGFATSGLPSLLSFFQQKGDQKHELEMAKMQNEQQLAMAERGFKSAERVEEIKFEEAQVEAFAQEKVALYAQAAKEADGASTWIINLRASVRPMVTYIIVALLVFVDVAGLIWAIHTGVDFGTALTAVFSETEEAILTSIIGFWFGSQAFSKR